MTNIFNMFWLNVGDWKLVPGPFMILLKWQYSKIWPFLLVEIYHFELGDKNPPVNLYYKSTYGNQTWQIMT